MTSKTLGILAVLLLVSVSVSSQTAKDGSSTFAFGNQVVTIPAPEGFEEAASQFEYVREYMSRTEAAGNDMLAVHLPHADCDKIRAGEALEPAFYTKVSARSDIRASEYSAERFANLITLFRKDGAKLMDIKSPEMKAVLARVNSTLSEMSKQRTTVDMTQPVNLGEIDTRPDIYSVMLLLSTKTNSANDSKMTYMVGGLSYVRVKQRLLYVYTYRRYESQADLETLRDFTKKWLGQVLAAN